MLYASNLLKSLLVLSVFEGIDEGVDAGRHPGQDGGDDVESRNLHLHITYFRGDVKENLYFSMGMLTLFVFLIGLP